MDPKSIYPHEEYDKNRRPPLNLPILVVEVGKIYVVIDGTHRSRVALREGKSIPAIILTYSEYQKFIKIKGWYGIPNSLPPGFLPKGDVIAKINNRVIGHLPKTVWHRVPQYSLKEPKNRLYLELNLEISHEEVIRRALENNPFPRKATAHYIDGRYLNKILKKLGIEERVEEKKEYHIEVLERIVAKSLKISKM